MKNKIIYLTLLLFLVLVGTVVAYTADSYDSVDLVLDETENYVADSWDNVQLVLNISVGPPTDSCTYGGSGNWEVDCSNDCSITSNVNLGGSNISIIGTGTFVTTANITNWVKTHIEGTDSSNICRVTCLKGGCFKE